MFISSLLAQGEVSETVMTGVRRTKLSSLFKLIDIHTYIYSNPSEV